ADRVQDQRTPRQSLHRNARIENACEGRRGTREDADDGDDRRPKGPGAELQIVLRYAGHCPTPPVRRAPSLSSGMAGTFPTGSVPDSRLRTRMEERSEE